MMAAGELSAGFGRDCRDRPHRLADRRLEESKPTIPISSQRDRTRSECIAAPASIRCTARSSSRRSAREHPWVARSLYDAFSQAKNEWLASSRCRRSDEASDKKYRELRKIVGHDPLPYGLETNLPDDCGSRRHCIRAGSHAAAMSSGRAFRRPAEIGRARMSAVRSAVPIQEIGSGSLQEPHELYPG